MGNELEDLEERVSIDDVPGRMLMGIDEDGNKRFLRCDEDGFLICKVVDVEKAEVVED